jgi:photosystem II reaction center protein PsbM
MKIAYSVLRESIYLPDIAVALFIIIPTSFLLILYVKTASESE